jgi:hypothetical protein
VLLTDLRDPASSPATRSTTLLRVAGVSFTALILWLLATGRPGPWRDEIATLAITRRSPSEIWHLAQNTDGF